MKHSIIYYNPTLKEKARYLRSHSTKSEVILWQYLKRKQLLGYDFHRQKPIDNYIVDFFCHELMLAIELDGITHSDKHQYDEKRDSRLNSLGIAVLHFKDYDVTGNISIILDEIKKVIDIIKTHPNPSREGI